MDDFSVWIYFITKYIEIYLLSQIFIKLHNCSFTDFPPCHGGQFRCRNALCIPATFHCDGYQDCGSGK